MFALAIESVVTTDIMLEGGAASLSSVTHIHRAQRLDTPGVFKLSALILITSVDMANIWDIVAGMILNASRVRVM